MSDSFTSSFLSDINEPSLYDIQDIDKNGPFKNHKYNNPHFQLKSDGNIPGSNAYMFSEYLFTRTLLLINTYENRKAKIDCTLCNESIITYIQGYNNSNQLKHYKYKHKEIAINKEEEKNGKTTSKYIKSVIYIYIYIYI